MIGLSSSSGVTTMVSHHGNGQTRVINGRIPWKSVGHLLHRKTHWQKALKWIANRPALCCTMLGLLLRLNSAWNGLVWDDKAAITLNGDVKMDTPISALLVHDYWGQPMRAVDSHKSWRPLATLTLRMNYAMHGLEPMGYHIVNIALHGVACGSVTRCATLLWRNQEYAWLAGLLFASHPVHTEAVASAVGRADVLCGALFALAVEAYLANWRRCAHALAFVAAMAKEIGVTAFACFTALDLIILLRHRRLKVVIRAVASLLCAAAVVATHASRHGERLLYQWTVLENGVHASLDRRSLATWLSYAHIHTRYFGKLVAPLKLCYDYGFPCVQLVTRLDDPRNAWTIVFYLAFGSVSAVCLAMTTRRRRHRFDDAADSPRLALCCIVLTVVPFAPASHVILPVGTILGERLLYAPSIGYCLGLALILIRVKSPAFSRTQTALFAILVCAFAARSGWRNADWRTESALFEAAMFVCPSSLKVLNNLAFTLLRTNDLERAERLLDAALETHPTFRSAQYNRGLVRHRRGARLAAIFDFSSVLDSDSADPKAHTYLGQELWLVSRQTLGLPRELTQALLADADFHLARGDPTLPASYFARASVAFDAGDYQTAHDLAFLVIDANVRADDASLRVLPGTAYNVAALAKRQLGDDAAAGDIFEAGLALDPECFDLLSNAASLFADKHDFRTAASMFQRALQLSPHDPALLNNVGYFEESQGHLQEALAFYRQAQTLYLPSHHPQIDTNVRNVQRRIELSQLPSEVKQGKSQLPPERAEQHSHLSPINWQTAS